MLIGCIQTLFDALWDLMQAFCPSQVFVMPLISGLSYHRILPVALELDERRFRSEKRLDRLAAKASSMTSSLSHLPMSAMELLPHGRLVLSDGQQVEG